MSGSFDRVRSIAPVWILLFVSCGDPPATTPTVVEAGEPKASPEPGVSAPSSEPEAAEAAVQRSMALERQGQLDQAAQAAAEALAAGGGRRSRLQAAKVAILRERYDEAESFLRPVLEGDPNDADAHYNLGLVAHRRGRYNAARSGYLAALRAREDYPDARYNLAVLTWSRNVKEEARHHVARFLERWPTDPRAAELTALVGSPARAPEPRPSP